MLRIIADGFVVVLAWGYLALGLVLEHLLVKV